MSAMASRTDRRETTACRCFLPPLWVRRSRLVGACARLRCARPGVSLRGRPLDCLILQAKQVGVCMCKVECPPLRTRTGFPYRKYYPPPTVPMQACCGHVWCGGSSSIGYIDVAQGHETNEQHRPSEQPAAHVTVHTTPSARSIPSHPGLPIHPFRHIHPSAQPNPPCPSPMLGWGRTHASASSECRDGRRKEEGGRGHGHGDTVGSVLPPPSLFPTLSTSDIEICRNGLEVCTVRRCG